jgi:hypothetical protein
MGGIPYILFTEQQYRLFLAILKKKDVQIETKPNKGEFSVLKKELPSLLHFLFDITFDASLYIMRMN